MFATPTFLCTKLVFLIELLRAPAAALQTDEIGLEFDLDPGVRVAQRSFPHGAPLGTAYTPNVMWCATEGFYRMYYSAWTDEAELGPRGYIMAAESTDGLEWKDSNGGNPIMVHTFTHSASFKTV
jgi:hypothetical protein